MEGLLLCATLKIAFDTRNIPYAINESKVIAICVFVILIIITIGFLFFKLFTVLPSTQPFTTSLCIFLSFFFYLHIYFGSKIFLLYCGADINHEFKIVYKTKTNDTDDANVLHGLYNDDAHDEYKEIEKSFLLKPPTSTAECEQLLNFIQSLKYKLIAEGMLRSDAIVSNKNQAVFASNN